MPNANSAPEPTPATENSEVTRRTYEAPRVTKKRSVAKVTLFSGGGATAGGLTAAG